MYLCCKMDKGDRYRIVIIVSFVLLLVCSAILLAGLWNNISMNPYVRSGNGLYFLVFAILTLSTLIFVLHLLEERKSRMPAEPGESPGIEPESKPGESPPESHAAPFEVDLDVIAQNIVPRIDPKESVNDFAERILLNLSRHFEVVQGLFYLRNSRTQEFEVVSTYAYTFEKDPPSFKLGDGIPGQVAKNRTMLNLTSVPDGYLQVQSGLGKAPPNNLLVIPLLLNRETIGVIELASFHALDEETEWTFKNLSKIIGNAMVTKIKSAGKK